MSLDVSLYVDNDVNDVNETNCTGIFIREDGQVKEISLEEWYKRFPEKGEPVVVQMPRENDCIFSRNITHNLNKMAHAAEIYKVIWRPDEVGFSTANQLIELLTAGLALLKSDPDKFKEYNPPNGWGTYDVFVDFVHEYLDACRRWPSARIKVSR